MGLDITAYCNLRPDPTAIVSSDPYETKSETHWNPSNLLVYTEKDFPGRTEGLTQQVYAYGEDDVFAFRCGAYSNYNRWRNELAVLAGYLSAKGVWDEGLSCGPFVELINFSDCEGVIGPVVAAKLARDFAEHEATILAKAQDDYFREKYRHWRKAFEMAAGGGAVHFH